jgi:hypothetical protein
MLAFFNCHTIIYNMQENSFLQNWFNHRKVSDSILSAFGVHWGSSPILGECIVIPVKDEAGYFSFNKYRRDPRSDAKPKYLYDKGGVVTLYGWWKAKEFPSILVTEGEIDCLTSWSANVPAITSTGGAMSFQEEWGQLLADKEVTLLFDNDSSGGTGMVKALSFVPHAYICFLPDRPGIKDVSDYMSAGGDLHELLRTRIRFSSLQDVIDDKARRQATWQSTWFHDAYIEANTVPEYVKTERKVSKKDGDMVARAKSYPITDLLKFNHSGFALCPAHNEKTPSLKYYADKNRCYCFGGCGKSFDAIDIYKIINNCTFKEAVAKLQ